jgi:hypothetical protein
MKTFYETLKRACYKGLEFVHNRKLFWLIFAFYGLISCNQSEKPTGSVQVAGSSEIIVIDSNYQAILDTIRITQIADSLFYVLLNGPELTGRKEIHKIMTCEKYLFVHADQRLFQYSWDGQFIKEYVNRNEYVSGFDILESYNLLLVAYSNLIMVHSLDGEYLNSLFLNNELQNIGSFFAAVDSNKLALAIWNKGTNASQMVIMDFDGNIIKEFPNTETFKSGNVPGRNTSRFHRTVFRENNNIYYQPLFNDTIFTIVDLKLEPVMIEKITFKVPLQERLEYTGDLQAYLQYCNENQAYITRSMATKRYFFIEAKNASLIKAFPVYMLYDKIDKQFNYYDLTVDFSKSVIHMGIYNDWDGGIALNTEFIDNGYMIGYYDVKRFLMFNKDEYELKGCKNDSICTVDRFKTRSQKISRQSRNLLLTNFLEGLEEKTGNHVLMFAKLKE